jgi:hypothetical protein
MPCVTVGEFLVDVGNPSETVTMRSGRALEMEWGDYFGPAVVTRTGLRCLTNAEFHDPKVDAWIVSHGGKSCLDDDGPLLPKPRKRRPERFDPTKPIRPKIVHKAKCVDREGNVSALCFRKPRVVDYSRENAVIVDANVTCPKCRAILDEKVTPCRP